MTKAEAVQFYRQVERLAIPVEDAMTLRRCSMTLHRWAEGECGTSGPSGSWAIVRDDVTGKPFREMYLNNGDCRSVPIADRERGALKRIAAVCERNGLHWYQQTDPRGCALYVAREPLNDQNYSSRGAAI